MRILFIAPLPPPVSGQSLAAQVFLDSIKDDHSVDVVDMNKDDFRNGFISLKRFHEVLKLLVDTHRKLKFSDIIYLHVSESIAGNLKDLLLFLICRNKLSSLYLHLHGGSLERQVFRANKLLRMINRYFVSRTAGVIILGQSHTGIYSDFMDSTRIHIVPNFAEDCYSSSIASIQGKFRSLQPLRILYLSNLISGKGYEFLLEGFILLSEEYRRRIEIVFAGEFGSDNERDDFLSKISPYDQLHYLGFVSGEAKKELLERAHILCLPSYLFEGQPICILEGYRAGCAVVTTGKGGISDVFVEGTNGYKIEERSAQSVADVLARIIDEPDNLLGFGLHNHELAETKYTISIHTNRLQDVMGIRPSSEQIDEYKEAELGV